MVTSHNEKTRALALLSGGLDSILAVKTAEEAGLEVKCLHFISPFFGKPELVEHWQRIHELDIDIIDVGDEYVQMMQQGPVYGYGKVLNPCVDCKILMMRRTKALLPDYDADVIISGEVLGQRPMSQRRDTLNVISRDAEVRDVLIRPLTAKRLNPTKAEEEGLVDREQLYGVGGRGRKEQLALAEKFQLREVPTPAGGCLLAEPESARRYMPIFQYSPQPRAGDFYLANIGRQYWAGGYWLSIGRDKADNTTLETLLQEEPAAGAADLVFKVKNFPGPLSIGRQFADNLWPAEVVKEAAAFAASFSPKAVKSGAEVEVTVRCGRESGTLTVLPQRASPLGFTEPAWEEAKEALAAQ